MDLQTAIIPGSLLKDAHPPLPSASAVNLLAQAPGSGIVLAVLALIRVPGYAACGGIVLKLDHCEHHHM